MFKVEWRENATPSNPSGEAYVWDYSTFDAAIDRAEQLDVDGAFKIMVRDISWIPIYSI